MQIVLMYFIVAVATDELRLRQAVYSGDVKLG